MKLYREYKLEKEARQREKMDQKMLGEEKEVVIIYESSRTAEKLKAAAGLTFLLILLMAVFLAIAGLAVYFTQ